MEAALLEIADTVARDWYLPGADDDDVRQIARIAAWQASERFDPCCGVPLRAWVAYVVRLQMASALKVATRQRARVLTDARRTIDVGLGETVDVVETIADPRAAVDDLAETRDELARVVAAMRTLTLLERHALEVTLAGPVAGGAGKQVDNAVRRARGKLAAAQPASRRPAA